MAATHIGPMSKLLLAEAAGASQVLNVQCNTVPQVHARETDTLHEISPREIRYIQRCRVEILERREIAGMGCLQISKSRVELSRTHSLLFNRSFGKGRHRQHRYRPKFAHREEVVGELLMLKCRNHSNLERISFLRTENCYLIEVSCN